MLYDGIASLSEKPLIVLDIGSAFTKLGFGGEHSPRFIIRSHVKCSRTGKIRNIYDYKDEDDLYEMLTEFLYQVYFRYLLVNSKERRMVVIESVLNRTVFRETLAKVVFNHFEVMSLSFVPSHLVALYALGIHSGLVVDLGFKETFVIPVFEGVSVLKAWNAQSLGAEAIHSNLKNLVESSEINNLSDEGAKLALRDKLNERVLEDIKVRACFVTTKDRIKRNDTNCPSVNNYSLGGDSLINISGAVRERATEILFTQDYDGISVPSMIVEAILKCPIDTRKTLAANIVLIGGTAMLPGLKSRLISELTDLAGGGSSAASCLQFKIHSTKVPCNYISWLGGSIFAHSECTESRSIDRDDYMNNKRIPDWSDQQRMFSVATKR